MTDIDTKAIRARAEAACCDEGTPEQAWESAHDVLPLCDALDAARADAAAMREALRRVRCVYWVTKDAHGKRIRGSYAHPCGPTKKWLQSLREIMPDGCKLYRVTVYRKENRALVDGGAGPEPRKDGGA